MISIIIAAGSLVLNLALGYVIYANVRYTYSLETKVNELQSELYEAQRSEKARVDFRSSGAANAADRGVY